MTRSRTVRGLVLAAATACALSGCGTHPGSAAEVGSTSISEQHVDDVATALCAAQSGAAQGAQQQDLAGRAARQGALDVLINSELSLQYGRSQGVEPDQEKVSAALTANKTTIDALPASERDEFRAALTDFAEGQLMLIEVGKAQLAKSGNANPTDQQALTEATRLRAAWAARHADVTVDPRYGTYAKGRLTAGSGSLSVPVSDNAVAGAKATPDASWVSSLPASQKCG